MPRLTWHLAEQPSPIEVDWQAGENNIFQVTFADTALSLELHWKSPAGGWVRDQDTGDISQFYCWVSAEQYWLWLDGKTYTLPNPLASKGRKASSGSSAPLSGEIKAPMPGTVLKILVEAGATVEANAPLIIMESMKMEMTLTAPTRGSVTGIHCTVGQLVEMNTVLAQLDVTNHDAVVSESR